MNILLIKRGNCIELRSADSAELPLFFIATLKEYLSFEYKKRKPKNEIITQTRYLCSVSKDKKALLFSSGLLSKVTRYLKTGGNEVWLKELTPKDRRNTTAPVKEILDNASYRPRQRECIDAIVNNACGVIKAPTGFGKTHILGMIIKAYPNSKIHVCTKSAKLAKDLKTRLLSFESSVGLIGAGKHEEGCRVTVFTADSLGYSDGKAEFFFFDECHTAAAPSYLKKILSIYNFSKRFGLTATPKGRSDGADALLEVLFGPVVFDMSYSDAVSGGLISPMKVRWLQCKKAPYRGLTCTSQVYRNRFCIWENDDRNRLIADDAIEHYANDKVLMLVSTVKHAFALKQYLPDYEVCYATMTPDMLSELKERGWIPEDFVPLNEKGKKKLFEDFVSNKVRKVIATDVWSTGVDVLDLSVVYNISGRVSKILTTQGAGRASRLFDGKEFGQIVDVRDCFAKDFDGFSWARNRTYRELGWSQIDFGS